ncbi:multidrug effflux MFS transporter [Paenibacillus arenilitoris]|uniref:multidrug effflux MFS transporter n=1 Tax=Paenibacillus arenilitoris TaxID=2772299 RepID=UPI001CC26AAC|nr:multidrug effflux MFS transporter [Paenibacillus arenilitoris]
MSGAWTLVLFGSLTAFGPLTLDLYLSALPEIGKELGAGASLTQLSLTSCLIGLAAGQMLIGPISDVKGRRLPLIVGLVCYVVSALACYLAPTIGLFIAFRLLQGLAAASGLVIARAALRDLYDGPRFTKASARLVLVMGAAPIFAPMLGARVVEASSWRILFLGLSFIGAVMLLTVFFYFRETLLPERRSRAGLGLALGRYAMLLRDRTFMACALTQGFLLAALFAYLAGSPYVLQELFGLTPERFSLAFGLNGFGFIAASQLVGWLAGRVSETRLLRLGIGLACLGSAALLSSIALGTGLYGILPSLFVLIASMGIVAPCASSLALQNQGGAAGAAAALLGLTSFLFGAASSPLVGLGGSGTAVPFGAVIAASTCAAAVCSYTLLRRKRNE